MGNVVEITVPSDQREGTESVIGKWLKAVGDTVKENEPLLEINTDKVTLEVAAPASGVLTEICKKTKDKIDLSEVLGKIEVGVAPANNKDVAKLASKASKQGQVHLSVVECGKEENFSPAVKKALKDHNIDPHRIKGTGAGARITMNDIEAYLSNATVRNDNRPARGGAKKIAHTPMRKNIAHHMVQSMTVAPHVTTVFQADLSRILEHRHSHKAEFEKKGVKLTLTAYFIQAAVAALRAVPEVNSRWGDDAIEILEDINIGIAAAVENSQGDSSAGLVVPVLKGAQDLDLMQVAANLQMLTEKARTGKLNASDLKDGTFTISNHGVSGSLFAAPIIINQPQSAILGIGKLEKRPVVGHINGRDSLMFIPAVYVTLTIDHRVLDGFLANKFLTKFVETIESY